MYPVLLHNVLCATAVCCPVLPERRHSGDWAAYYNGGNIPIAQVDMPSAQVDE